MTERLERSKENTILAPTPSKVWRAWFVRRNSKSIIFPLAVLEDGTHVRRMP